MLEILARVYVNYYLWIYLLAFHLVSLMSVNAQRGYGLRHPAAESSISRTARDPRFALFLCKESLQNVWKCMLYKNYMCNFSTKINSFLIVSFLKNSFSVIWKEIDEDKERQWFFISWFISQMPLWPWVRVSSRTPQR